jgi:pimeloyl-ACP methyl ester carboxylesterase
MGLPRDRRAAARMPHFGADDRELRVDLVVAGTEDGQRWDGMILRPGSGSRRKRLAVLVVHGSVGNYITGVPRRVSFGLAGAGFTTMSVNTRMANYGVIFGGGLMHRTPLDLDAALAVLRRRGFARIVLLGFSLGATMVTHYQALRRPPDVVGVCTLAHPASLPSALRLRWDYYDSVPTYAEVADEAHRRLAPDYETPQRDRIFIVRRARGFGDRPADGEVWTYRTWWFSRGPRAPHAESRLRIGSVTVPIALIQAGDDELVRGSEGSQLEGLARQGDCPGVTLETIPGADHVFAGCEDQLTEAVVAWLDERL